MRKVDFQYETFLNSEGLLSCHQPLREQRQKEQHSHRDWHAGVDGLPFILLVVRR